ncbi:hypothetical protein L3X38_003162 [Prunus dulcis]|uniref:Transposase MuDR plant domain-containing protein n=1 Tax=Prunus dulcis TaxID=3755 RepID=A0AAD4ZLJ0_PRUDU|nr:hypothetical protein L3X38_003162 [Prunus dulcis]
MLTWVEVEELNQLSYTPLAFEKDKGEFCTLEIHHGGVVQDGMYKEGTLCYLDNCVDDYLSLLDLRKIGIALGYEVDLTKKEIEKQVKTWTQTYVEWPSLQSEEYNYGRFNEDQMKEVNEALDTDEHVVSLGDCEAAVDEEEEESEFVDKVNVEIETQGLREISDDGADSNTLYFDGNTSDDEKTSRHVTKKQRIRLPKFKQYRRATDLKNPEFHLGMQFENREHLKEAIKEYAFVNGKLLKFDKNDKRRVKVLCRGSGNCAFVLYASRIDKEE